MMNEATKERLGAISKDITALYDERRQLLQESTGETVEDYTFSTPDGEKKLSELFGDKDELILVHNMGKSCPYCTLWADGLNGVAGHLADRAGFVVASPDSPDVQQEFASSRDWSFPMVSTDGSRFTHDMGFAGENEEGQTHYYPGYSVFSREEDGTIRRRGQDWFGPMDLYSGLWHMFAMLPKGSDDWFPRYSYGKEKADAS